MSLDAILWALKDAPVVDAEERLVLVTLAETADVDGCNAYPSTKTVARLALVHQRTVHRRLDALRSRGLIAYGDPMAAARIPEHRRPVVYDLQIPYSWFANVDRVNEVRDTRGRLPLTPELRPDLDRAPKREPRRDKGRPRRRGRRGDSESGHDSEPGDGPKSGDDSQSAGGATTSHPNQSSKENPSPSSAASNARYAHHQAEAGEASRRQEPSDTGAVLDAVCEVWCLGDRSRNKLRPLVAQALEAGHRPDDVVAELNRDRGGADSPLGVLRYRLDDLPTPTAPRPATKPPCADGYCDNRWIVNEDRDPIRRCDRCGGGTATGDEPGEAAA